MKKGIVAFTLMAVFYCSAHAEEENNDISSDDNKSNSVSPSDVKIGKTSDSDTSPILNINRAEKKPDGDIEGVIKSFSSSDNELQYRTYDGSYNNLFVPHMNEIEAPLRRVAPAYYGDGISSIADDGRPNPRAVSSAVASQSQSMPNPKNASDYLWQWGQFLDHDLSLSEGVDPAEPANIPIPRGDKFFDPQGTGDAFFAFNRAIYEVESENDVSHPRQQINEITGWIDASNVYGSDTDRALALRENDETGKLKTSSGNLLPFNEDGLPNAGGDSSELFVAGDPRANEQIGLTVMHTLFVREHNRLAEIFAKENPSWSGEEIYQRARRIVGAQMQVITYKEFLPVLLGEGALSEYKGYNPNVDANIANVFSTAAYRLGHSMLSNKILRLDARNRVVDEGNLELRDAFFATHVLTEQDGLEPILRGLGAQVCQTIDPFVVDEVRNFLFGQPGQGGFDLISLNIHRGRDHGLASYNDMRAALGLSQHKYFSRVTSSSSLRRRLSSVYSRVDEMDVWVAGLSEDPVPGSMLGELFHKIVKDQFEALRDGDRFWYEASLSKREIEEVENTSLADIIRRNTGIKDEISDHVFIVGDVSEIVGIGVQEALSRPEGTAVTVTGVISESFNNIYALKMHDVENENIEIVVKLEPGQRLIWSPLVDPSVLGKTIVIEGVRDLYALQSSIEYVTSIREL